MKASLKAMAKDAKTKTKSSAPKNASKPVEVFKSSEFIQQSEEEDEEDEEEDGKSTSDEEIAPIKAATRLPATNGKTTNDISSSSEEESEEESDEDGEESGSEKSGSEAAESSAEESEHTKKSTSEPATRTISFKTAPYKAPTGFEQGRVEGNMKASQMFEKSNLKGKQIWYFTAPASVPISSIESMSLLDVKAGEPVLKHKNDDYGFMQDSAEDKTYTKIMVPSSSDNGYKTSSREIDQIMHLQHIVKLPGVHEGVDSNSSSASKATIPTIKSARPQPKGLKMRFRPLGFGSGEPGTIGSEDSQASDEEMDEAPSFRVPTFADSDEEVAGIPQPKSAKKIKTEKHSSDKSLKRKNGDKEEKKSKISSFSLETHHDKKLKRSKKNPREPQTSQADSPSASTNTLGPIAPKHQTPILPPKVLNIPRASGNAHSSQSLHVSVAKKSIQSSPVPIDVPSRQLATSAGLTVEEKRKERKKAKKLRRGNADGSQ